MKSYHQTQLRIRYSETDQMGVVHHANYPLYLEVARIEWLRELGVSYKVLEEQGIGLPVTNLNVNFKKSALYDDLITVKTWVEKTPTVRIEFKYEILNQNHELLVTASTELVFINLNTKRPTKAPQYVLDAITNFG